MLSLLSRAQRTIVHRYRCRGLSPIAKSVMKERLTYLSPEKLARIEAFSARATSGDHPGDILEFGVALGGSAIVLASQAQKSGSRFFGFDVFGMIPPPTSDKDDAQSKERYRVIASGAARGFEGDLYYGYRENLLEEVQRSFRRYGVEIDGKNRRLLKGLFEETLPSYQGTISFAHVDCDWYDPVKLCLESISQRLAPGGIIVLDDYHDYGGAKIAADEFLKSHSGFQLDDGPNVALLKMST